MRGRVACVFFLYTFSNEIVCIMDFVGLKLLQLSVALTSISPFRCYFAFTKILLSLPLPLYIYIQMLRFGRYALLNLFKKKVFI